MGEIKIYGLHHTSGVNVETLYLKLSGVDWKMITAVKVNQILTNITCMCADLHSRINDKKLKKKRGLVWPPEINKVNRYIHVYIDRSFLYFIKYNYSKYSNACKCIL